jgi:hypothetical protein
MLQGSVAAPGAILFVGFLCPNPNESFARVVFRPMVGLATGKDSPTSGDMSLDPENQDGAIA